MSNLARENTEKTEYEHWKVRVQTYRSLESIHCLLQEAIREPKLAVAITKEALMLVEQTREPYMYLSVYKEK